MLGGNTALFQPWACDDESFIRILNFPYLKTCKPYSYARNLTSIQLYRTDNKDMGLEEDRQKYDMARLLVYK